MTAMRLEVSMQASRIFSSSCPGLSRPSTSFLPPDIKDVDGRDKPGHDDYFELRLIFRSARMKLRPTPKCQSRLGPRRIVEKALAEYPVAAPLLQRDLVDPVHLAGFIRQLENPVNGDVVAFDHGRHRLGIDVRHARKDAALVGDQQVAA